MTTKVEEEEEGTKKLACKMMQVLVRGWLRRSRSMVGVLKLFRKEAMLKIISS